MEAIRYLDGRDLKEQMRLELGKPSRRVIANFGEGGAVVCAPAGRLAVQSTLFVEEVHFDLSYTTPREVGHKALAVALSALAAVGAAPLYAVLALGLKQDQGEIFVAELMAGAAALARVWGIDLVAETSAASPSGAVITVTAVGQAEGGHFSPSGAKPGDHLLLSGPVGSSAAGLTLLKRLGRTEALKQQSAYRAHLLPEPRLAESAVLKATGAVTAMVDVRDGLTRDLYRLAEASRVGCLVDEGRLVIASDLLKIERNVQSDARAWALYGGEDFSLLYTVSPRHYSRVEQAMKRKKLPIAVVGSVTDSREKIRLKNLDGEVVPLLPKLWSHFARRSRTRWR